MGGEARLTRQTERGRLNARERIRGPLRPRLVLRDRPAGRARRRMPPVPGDALVAGSGRIDGRPALAGAEDVTVLGGSIGSGASDKRYRLCQLALQERVPLVMMLEGAGHRVTDSAGGRRPGDLMGLAELSGIVPMVCLVLGASAGHGALTAPLSDFAVMTESASLFAAGPPLVKSATGEDVTKEDARRPSGGGRRVRRRAQRGGGRPRGHCLGPALPRLLSAQCLGTATAPGRARHRPPPGRRHLGPHPVEPPAARTRSARCLRRSSTTARCS